jgi:hypothetical protein
MAHGRNLCLHGRLIFLPQFSCPLEHRAWFVRVGGFDQPPSVPHPRPSRLFFLLTSHRRHSAIVSEILNVAPIGSLSTAVRHPFKLPNPGDSVETTDFSSNTTSSGHSGCLLAYHPGTDACQVSPRAV